VISMKMVQYVLILILFCGIMVSACLSQAPQIQQVPQATALTTVRVAYQPTASNGPLYIAEDEGFFAKQGIDVEFVKTANSAAALPLLVSGDVAASTGPLKIGLLNAVIKGEHVRIVADKGSVTSGSCTVLAMMVRKDLFDKDIVTNVSDLKGRKIATHDADYDLFRSLAVGNLTKNDIETVDMDFPTTVSAFQNGAIDAGVLTEPYLTQARNSGSAVVLVPAQDYMPGWPMPLYYGPAILDKDPELGRRFMVAFLQGVKQYNEGKTDRNLAIMENYTHLDRDLLNQTCWWPVATDGNPSRQPVREYTDWMYANKMISQNLNDDQLFNMSYVTYANGVLQNTTSSG
jgi:NitT/TauT family transport system substrate-binding protein